MSSPVKIINPVSYPHWDEIVLSSGASSLFLSSAWARVLVDTYGYTPLYFTMFDADERLVALVPLMEVKSIFTGSRGVSLPFSDYCEPIWGNETDREELINRIIEHAWRQGWKYVELRPEKKNARHWGVSTSYLNHRLNISLDEEKLFESCRASTRRNIKKALDAGVACSINTSMQSVEQFYALNCMTRKRHGIPPQPFSFFKNVHRHVISQGHGVVVLASHKQQVVAGAVYFQFGKQAMYKYGASDLSYQQLRANYLVMWEAIRWYCRDGYEVFDMGRTEPSNTGLNQFKTGWNAQPSQIFYYKYDMKKQSFATASDRQSSLSERLLPHLPLALLKMIGTVAYRHVA